MNYRKLGRTGMKVSEIGLGGEWFNGLTVGETAAILDAVKLLELEADRVYTIRTNSRLERIPYKSIYYIERDGKNAAIVTAAGVSKVRRTLAQIHEELDAEEFIYIDRGCIVNLTHIAQVKGNTAVLKDGSVLPVSRSHLQSVKEEINRYWGSHI